MDFKLDMRIDGLAKDILPCGKEAQYTESSKNMT